MKKLLFAFGLLYIASFVSAGVILPYTSHVPVAYAQGSTTLKPNTIPCSNLYPCISEKTQKEGARSIRAYITETFASNFFKAFLGLSAATAVVFVIVGGLQMHFAVGNEETLGSAKKTITWAIVGLVLSILSLAIIQIIANLNFK